jgi:hypothetical protein
MPDEWGDPYGGYYDKTWQGIGQVMLPNFKYDPVKHGNAVEIKMQFLNEEPCGLRKFGKRSANIVTSIRISTSKHGKKRKVAVKTER